MKTLNIKDYNDVIIIKQAIINNEEFKLGEIQPLKFKIIIDGGRFTEYDIKYIDIKIAKIIISYQNNYTKLLNELEKKFKIKFSEKDKILKFKLSNGSLELLAELLNFKEVLKNMESIHKLYAILSLVGSWFAYLSFTKYIEKEIKKIETEREIKEKELEGQEKEKYTQTMDKTLDTFRDIMMNKELQNSINTPKKEVLSLLDENEKIIDNSNEYRHKDADKFNYIKPNIEDIEEIIEEKIATLDSYVFTKEGKPFKIQGISPLANSSVLEPRKRMKLITKAENQEQVKLKLKIIKDGITKKPKEAYILDFIE